VDLAMGGVEDNRPVACMLEATPVVGGRRAKASGAAVCLRSTRGPLKRIALEEGVASFAPGPRMDVSEHADALARHLKDLARTVFGLSRGAPRNAWISAPAQARLCCRVSWRGLRRCPHRSCPA